MNDPILSILLRRLVLPVAFLIAVTVMALLFPLPAPSRAGSGNAITCDSAPLIYDASTNGATRLFASSDTKRTLYICGYLINVGGTATNVKLQYGTGSACASNTVDLTPNWVLGISGQVNMQGGNWEGMTAPPGFDFCIKTSAGNPVQALVYVTYF